MSASSIKEQLHNYLEIADDRKLKAIYVMVEDEIKESFVEYTDEFKAELDRRLNHYQNGGKMVRPAEMTKRLNALRKKRS